MGRPSPPRGRKVGVHADLSPEVPSRLRSRAGAHRGGPITSSECLDVAALLDEHHAPETNGRIAVCHTCGARTEGPEGGHHVLQEGRVTARLNGSTLDVDSGYCPFADPAWALGPDRATRERDLPGTSLD